MAGLFSKPSPPSLPPVPPPAPIPQAGPESAEEAARRARSRAGFRKTLLTGELEPVQTGKKRLLGGS